MRGFSLDATEADTFFDTGDPSPGLEEVARLVRAASGPPGSDELVGEGQAVAALAAAVRGAPGVSGPVHEGRRPMLTNVLAAKAAAAAAAALIGGGAAAAATGSLPAPVQSTVSRGLAAVGVSVPNPDAAPSTHAPPPDQGPARPALPSTTTTSTTTSTTSTTSTSTTTPTTTSTTAPTPTGPALGTDTYGLCVAYVSSGTHSAGTGVGNEDLAAAAAAAGESVTAFCSTVPPAAVPTSGTAPGEVPEGGSPQPGAASSQPAEPPQAPETAQSPAQGGQSSGDQSGSSNSGNGSGNGSGGGSGGDHSSGDGSSSSTSSSTSSSPSSGSSSDT